MTCNMTIISELPSDAWRITFGVIMVLIFLIATVENAIVLFVLYRYHALHTISNKILSGLALSNLLTGLILAPLYIAQLFSEDVMLNCTVDLSRRYISAVLLGASSFTLALIAFDRRRHLQSLHGYRMKKKRFYLLISTCWLVPIIIPAFRLVDEDDQAYGIVVIIFNLLMAVVIVAFYVSLLFALKNYRKMESSHVRMPDHVAFEWRAGKVVIMIIVLSLIMLLPVLIYCTMDVSQRINDTTLAETYIITMSLGMLNAVVNPLIYCYRIPILKTHIQRCLRFNSTQDYSVTRRNIHRFSMANVTQVVFVKNGAIHVNNHASSTRVSSSSND